MKGTSDMEGGGGKADLEVTMQRTVWPPLCHIYKSPPASCKFSSALYDLEIIKMIISVKNASHQ